MVSLSIWPLSYNFTETVSEFIINVSTRLFSLDRSKSWVFVLGLIVRFLSPGCAGPTSAFFTVSALGFTKTVPLFELVGLFFLGVVAGCVFGIILVAGLLLAIGLFLTSGGLLVTGEFLFLKNDST